MSYVNPFIGTANSNSFTKWGSEGGTYPGAVAPWGFIQLTPETRVSGVKGYKFNDSSIYFFSCIRHRSGFPNGSSGQLAIMPVSNSESFATRIYHQNFSHEKEKAEPGYYSVLLDDGILSEATVSKRAGMFRFTFPKGVAPKIFIGDAGNINIKSGKVLQGTNFNNVFNFDKTIINQQKVNKGCILSFGFSPAETTVVVVRLSVSSVGFKSAQKNIDQELSSTDFDHLKQKTSAEWAKELSVVEIEDSSETNKTIFYTALYHSLLLPWTISDADGNYVGADGKIYKATGINQYGGFSPWDTFRSLHPLLSLLYPSRQKDMVLSMLDIYKQSGNLPIESMTGNHAAAIIVDSYMKGITGFDSALAYAAMKKSIVNPPFLQQDMEVYQSGGYIPFSLPESVTRTVEYAYDDWALSTFAKNIMHDEKEYQLLLKRGYNYRNLFNVQDLFMLPRNKAGFNTQPGTSGYKEGDQWAYSYFAPQNVGDLINLMGGNKAFADRLDSALTNNLIVFDNETVFHVPYLFNYANDPARTQKWVSNVMKNRYTATPGGLPGNDDLGSVSSWYVFSAMGIYPVCPGRPLYNIGCPIFKSLTIHLENGKRFIINSNPTSPQNIYIKSLLLNGKFYNKLNISHQSIVEGGKLIFNLDSAGNKNWQSDDSETNPKNNPLFEVTNFHLSKNKLKPNELFQVVFSIKNRGSLGTKIINIFANGAKLNNKNCFVPANSTITDSISCRLYTYGKMRITNDALQEKTVEIINSGENTSETFQVDKLLVKPIIRNNEVQKISFRVQNVGGVKRSFQIPLLIDDSIAQTHTVLLAPGEITNLSQIISVTKVGLHTVCVNGIRDTFKVFNNNRDAIVLDLDIMNNKTGNLIHDNSGFGNDARIIKTVSKQDISSENKFLFGKDSYLEMPSSNSLDSSGKYITMMAWICPKSRGEGLVDLFTKGDNNVLQTTGNETLTFFAGGWGRGDCTVELPADWINNWHHIAGVCDGKTLKVYMDGKLAGTTLLDEEVNLSNINKWTLGRNQEFPSQRIFNGYINKVKVFTQPLTADDIISQMQDK